MRFLRSMAGYALWDKKRINDIENTWVFLILMKINAI
jgi:hypothetical protein